MNITNKCAVLLLITLWSVQAVQWLDGDNGKVKWSHNCDYRGGDIGNQESKGEHCGLLCFGRSGCTRFVWNNYQGGTCWLKNGNGEPFDTYNNGICGEIVNRGASDASPPELVPTGGITFRTIPRLSVRACQGYIQIAEHRVYGGRLADKDEFPWMATLGTRQGNMISFNCGGTIISRYFILTAAHCLTNSQPNFIRVGTNIRFSNDGTDLDVLRIIKHPDYSQETYKNDIALIQVRQKIPVSLKILPACLRTDLSDVWSNIPLIATGWGETEAQYSSNSLMKTSIKTVPLQSCRRHWSLDEGQYCAHDPTLRNDTCFGDSGGPLQLFTSDSVLAYIVGVVSFGNGCATQKPGVYARVAYYLDWIEPYIWYD